MALYSLLYTVKVYSHTEDSMKDSMRKKTRLRIAWFFLTDTSVTQMSISSVVVPKRPDELHKRTIVWTCIDRLNWGGF